jgi:hypothetical protein
MASISSASTSFKFPHKNKYLAENFPNANGNITINLNSVVFEYNIQMCEISYSGTVINALPNFELYVTTIDFFDLTELRKLIGPLNYIKLDQVYNFVGKRQNKPQSTKSPVPFLPFYDNYTGTIYYSNEPIENIIERMNHALTSLHVQFTRNNYCYDIQGSKIESEINIYLTDEEDGFIIEFRDLERREFNIEMWNFKNKWAVLMNFIKEEIPYPYFVPSFAPITTNAIQELTNVLPPFVEFPSSEFPSSL